MEMKKCIICRKELIKNAKHKRFSPVCRVTCSKRCTKTYKRVSEYCSIRLLRKKKKEQL